MTDHANISLKEKASISCRVGAVLHPDRVWKASYDGAATGNKWNKEHGMYEELRFCAFTDAAGFQMAKWLVHNSPYLEAFDLLFYMESDNPNLALATAIIELKENG